MLFINSAPEFDAHFFFSANIRCLSKKAESLLQAAYFTLKLSFFAHSDWQIRATLRIQFAGSIFQIFGDILSDLSGSFR
jgi:hypothetical protein